MNEWLTLLWRDETPWVYGAGAGAGRAGGAARGRRARIIHARHAIAEGMSQVLAQRQQQNEAMNDAFRKAQGEAGKTGHGAQILMRMREFFRLH